MEAAAVNLRRQRQRERHFKLIELSRLLSRNRPLGNHWPVSRRRGRGQPSPPTQRKQVSTYSRVGRKRPEAGSGRQVSPIVSVVVVVVVVAVHKPKRPGINHRHCVALDRGA